jgi:ribonuclease BN (tRNA processing enzyme)
MRVQLLPSNLSEPTRLQPTTTFLIDGTLAIDGGSLGYALNAKDQLRVRRIVVTHSHNDHIASLPIFVAEVFPFISQPIEIYGTGEVLESLRNHVFNDVIWPDFHAIELSRGNGTGLRYVEIEAGKTFRIDHLSLTPVRVNHVVPTVGFVVENDTAGVIFTADTYHTDELWEAANRMKRLHAVFVDVSYPNEMEALAAVSKHLTPQGLKKELEKLKRPAQVFAFHLKPQFRDRVLDQLGRLGLPHVSVAEIGHEYRFGDGQVEANSGSSSPR